MNIDIKFPIGSIVYLRTDPEQFERLITGFIVRPNNQIIYYVAFEERESTHYELEISKEKDHLKSI
jgi:hypothetical protein